mmetsp:Transcript_9844/g.19988  ORF Transcript_9844/g.19988 Transcript_9844/m.19988 type:complete len:345 (+) Transcript_9844:121-1155(+)
MCWSDENTLSSSAPTDAAMCPGSTCHACSERKGPKERWLITWDTSMVSQLNSCESDTAWILSMPGARCTCRRPDTMQPMAWWESATPSLLASTVRVAGIAFLACATKCSAHPVMAGTDRSPWYDSCCVEPLSSLRKTRMVGNASMRYLMQSDSDCGDVQSTLPRRMRLSAVCFSPIWIDDFSHTGASFWHQWHQGAKKLTIMTSYWWCLASKLSVVSCSALSGPSCFSFIECLASRFGSTCLPSTEPASSSFTLLTRAARPASCVPMKFVASTLANSHLRCGNVMLKLTCSVSSTEFSKWSSTTLESTVGVRYVLNSAKISPTITNAASKLSPAPIIDASVSSC